MTFRDWLRRVTGGTTTSTPPPSPTTPGVVYDVPYGTDREQVLDVYPGKGPVVLVIHGGGWGGGENSRRAVVVICQALAEQGYCALAVNYRLVTASRPGYPMQHEDITRAADWAKQNGAKYGANTAKVFLLGGSAGAHLAALTGLYMNRMQTGLHVAGVIAMSGPMDFVGAIGKPVPPTVAAYLGYPLDTAPRAVVEGASPKWQIHPAAPPVLLLHGEGDPIVPVAESRLMHTALGDAGEDTTLRVVAGSAHGMALWNVTRGDVLAFLRR